MLNRISPVQIGLRGLVLSVPISAFAHRLIVAELSFPRSPVPVALVIGCGYAYLGGQWSAPLSSRSRIVRMLLVFVFMAMCLVAVWLVDGGLLSLLSDGTHIAVYEVPGVYCESSPGFRQLSIDADVPPYWLVAMIYGLLSAAAGNSIHRAYKRRSI